MPFSSIAFVIVALIVGLVSGSYLGDRHRKKIFEEDQDSAYRSAQSIIQEAEDKSAQVERDAKAKAKEILVEGKENAQSYRSKVEEELEDRRNEVQKKENRLNEREDNLDKRESAVSEKESNLESKSQSLDNQLKNVSDREEEAEQLLADRQAELERISALSQEEAKKLILEETEKELSHEIANKLRDAEQEYKDKADKIGKSIVLEAIQTSGADTVADASVTRVDLPNDDMKGRIIGKNGRNIKTIEALTGVDLIIDDTPETVIISGFDPIRREIARIALENLIKDGRIQPARIEEAVEKARKEMDTRIRDIGEQTTFDLGIHDMHPDLVKLVGRLNYRTSYGQNVLNHSVEVAKLAGTMAAELGEDELTARRAGLLHDIGKAVDHEVEGTHVQIGTELARKYGESDVVINAIASHHGDVEQTSAIAVIVQVADSLSAARPGARSESLENYVQRLTKLEDIANSYDGVESAFAIQAGREIRVVVSPESYDDDDTVRLSHDLSKRIEEEVDYPGQVKVTVIREKRAVDYAK